MVTSITNYGRSGAADWLMQRVSAVILLAYFLCVGAFIVTADGLTYEAWSSYMDSRPMRIFSLLAVISLAAHAWIGMWSVSTDYLTTRMAGAHGNQMRWIFQAACAVLIFVYFVWTIEILWGV
jgi:succinate dehydrogenase / fumarate reductase membrane anchor subunit